VHSGRPVQVRSAGVGEKHPDPYEGAEPDERLETADGSESAERRGHPSSQVSEDAVRDDMSQRLADLARTMLRQPDTPAVMEIIVSSLAGTIPCAEQATVSLVQSRRRVVSAAVTGDLAECFDDWQQQTQEGPCLDRCTSSRPLRPGISAAVPPRVFAC
jgi:hypothetical protein